MNNQVKNQSYSVEQKTRRSPCLLSVVISAYRSPSLVLDALSELSRALEGLRYEVFVIDSGVTQDLTKSINQQFPQVKYLPFIENLGYARAVNKGLKMAQGRYILVQNADIKPDQNAVRVLINFIETHPRVAVVAPVVVKNNNTLDTNAFRFYTLGAILARRTFWGSTPWGRKALDRFEMHDHDRGKPHPVDWVKGNFFIVRKRALEKVGLFDERFFMYFEDVDLCRRMWKYGWKVFYIPQARVRDLRDGTSRKTSTVTGFFNTYFWIHTISGVKYWWKWYLKKEI